MYLILISVTAAVLAGVAVFLVGGGWFLTGLAAIVAFLLSQLIIGRRLRKRLEPAMQQVRRQVEAGMLRQAVDTLDSLLPLGAWIPLLRPQLHAQIGVLANHLGDRERAMRHLLLASRRSPEAQLLLAALHERAGNLDLMRKSLLRAAPYQKKSPLFHNVHAWLLDRHGDARDAIARLHKFIQKHGDDASRDNLNRLENGKKMNMKAFGFAWFALGYERPPQSMGQVQTARKGFRQPPKSKR